MNPTTSRNLLIILTAFGIVTAILSELWVALPCVWTLWIVWRLLLERQSYGPPVIPLAISFQWLQLTFGVFYYAFTGIEPMAMQVDYHPMIYLGIVSLPILSLGIFMGKRLFPAPPFVAEHARPLLFSMNFLFFINLFLLIFKDQILTLAWNIPLFSQAIIAIYNIKTGFLYLLLRELSRREKNGYILVILAAEVLVGFMGYFADWRIPIILYFLVALEMFLSTEYSRNKLRLGFQILSVTVFAFMIGILWSGLKGDWRYYLENEYIADSGYVGKATKLTELIEAWNKDESVREQSHTDLVDRIWDIYYSSLTIERVPKVIPHSDGELIGDAIRHILMPRFLFPDKSALPSESFKVRKYSGVMVAGGYDNATNIAFGYILESYVDYGVPLLGLPIFLFGILVGLSLSLISRLIRHVDMEIAILITISWQVLSRIEISWVKMLGQFFTWLFYTVLASYLLTYLFRATGGNKSRRRGKGKVIEIRQ
ncbi:MAG: hypothetical protein HQL82_02630 [Magnetococcales bacterium]|nr:hypothetical protein [Magnetococcales bacterium]